MGNKTDIPEVVHPIPENAESVTVACPTCGVANVLRAEEWQQVDNLGRFLISPVTTYGTTCPSCRNDFGFRPLPLADAVRPMHPLVIPQGVLKPYDLSQFKPFETIVFGQQRSEWVTRESLAQFKVMENIESSSPSTLAFLASVEAQNNNLE